MGQRNVAYGNERHMDPAAVTFLVVCGKYSDECTGRVASDGHIG
jgi:hypothetical protein